MTVEGFDGTGRSIGLVTGGIWVYTSDVAEAAGVTEEEIVSWAETSRAPEYVTDELVDTAIRLLAEAYRCQ